MPKRLDADPTGARTAAAGSHNGDALPWLCCDVDALEHFSLWVVAEVHVLHAQTGASVKGGDTCMQADTCR